MPCIDRGPVKLHPDGHPFDGVEVRWEPIGVFCRLFVQVLFGKLLESGRTNALPCDEGSDGAVELPSRFRADRYGEVGIDVTWRFFVPVPSCAGRGDPELRCEYDAWPELIERPANLFEAGSNCTAVISLVVAHTHVISLGCGWTGHKINPVRHKQRS